jgi:hypothetical protein
MRSSLHSIQGTGGNAVEYSQFFVNLHMARHWKPYSIKLHLPLVVCTAYSLSARILPVEPLMPRHATHTTMLLATTALLFVIERTVPKTPYLTVMDRFVVTNIAIQVLNAGITWAQLYLSAAAAATLDHVARYVMPLLLFASVYHFFLSRILSEPRRTAWPSATLKQNHGVEYHLFEAGKNGVLPYAAVAAQRGGSRRPPFFFLAHAVWPALVLTRLSSSSRYCHRRPSLQSFRQ